MDWDRWYLKQGIEAVKAGNTGQARQYLTRALQGDPTGRLAVEAWLWLSTTCSDVEERRECLLRALALDPSDPVVRRGLALLEGKIPSPDWVGRGVGDQVEAYWSPGPGQPVAEPAEAHPEGREPLPGRPTRRECNRCGGHLVYSPEHQSQVCAFCGRVQSPSPDHDVAAAEDIALTLPTPKAQRRESQERVLKCRECGGTTTMPAGALTTTCPFCGTPYVVEAEEWREVVPPTGIIPFQLTSDQAQEQLWTWLGQGWFRPDDLVQQARQEALRGVYVPFWLFDGSSSVRRPASTFATPEIRVRVGGFHVTVDAPRRGSASQHGAYSYFDLFDDIPVPAGQALPRLLLKALQYDWDAIVPYAPEYVTGWPAELAQVSLADAALDAREQIVEATRQALEAQLDEDEPMPGIRANLDTYRLVLLPVWVVAYRYRGQKYTVLINGQNGRVAGSAPMDWVKVVLWAAVGILLIALLGMIVYAL